MYATISLGRRSRWVAEYYPVDILEDTEDSLLVRFAASDPLVAARLLLRLGPQRGARRRRRCRRHPFDASIVDPHALRSTRAYLVSPGAIC